MVYVNIVNADERSTLKRSQKWLELVPTLCKRDFEGGTAKKCTKRHDARANLFFANLLPFLLTSTSSLLKLPDGQFVFPVPSNSPRILCDSLLGPVFWSQGSGSIPSYELKKKENSNTRKLQKIFRAPDENRTHDPPSSSSDTLTTEFLFQLKHFQ